MLAVQPRLPAVGQSPSATPAITPTAKAACSESRAVTNVSHHSRKRPWPRARTPPFAEGETPGQGGSGHPGRRRSLDCRPGLRGCRRGVPWTPHPGGRDWHRQRSSRVSWLGPALSRCLDGARVPAQRAGPQGLEVLCTGGKAEPPSQAPASHRTSHPPPPITPLPPSRHPSPPSTEGPCLPDPGASPRPGTLCVLPAVRMPHKAPEGSELMAS